MAADGSYIPANVSRESWINVEIEVEQSMQSYLDSLDEELSNQPGFKKPPTKIVRKCRTTSQTDPDLSLIHIYYCRKNVEEYFAEVFRAYLLGKDFSETEPLTWAAMEMLSRTWEADT